MFILFEYQKYLGYDSKNHTYNYQFKLIDSDFEVEASAAAPVVASEAAMAEGVASAVVIQEYSKRNLNVAANLIRLFQFYTRKYSWITIEEQINWCRKYTPGFSKYEEDLQKYLPSA